VWNVRVVTVAALALAVFGCVSNQSGTLQDTVRNIDSGLLRIPYVSSSDLASEERGQRYQAATRFVRDKQCSAGTANPLFLTSLPLNVRLSGNLAGDGRIEFSAERAEGPGRSKPASGQGVEVLLRASTLADLPNEYLREMSALIQSKGLPDEIVQRLKKEIPGTYQVLTARIGKLVSDFDPNTTCGVVARKTTPSQPVASRAEAPRPAKPRAERAAGLFVPTF
jgi:hypothetical protein